MLKSSLDGSPAGRRSRKDLPTPLVTYYNDAEKILYRKTRGCLLAKKRKFAGESEPEENVSNCLLNVRSMLAEYDELKGAKQGA
jgi:hypothetical protein